MGRLDGSNISDNQDDATTSNNNSTADNTRNNSGGHDIHVLLPHMVRSNAEIREIVTGRIAAFSFNGGQPSSPLSSSMPTTAFADPLVVETFCRFLAANAVSNGAERLRRFLSDWIIPGATADATSSPSSPHHSPQAPDKRQRLSPKRVHQLPPYSLACVLYHVAAEAEMIPQHSSSDDSSDSTQASTTARTVSPHGTIDVLQRLSLPVMAHVLLGPVLDDALQRKQLKRQLKQHRKYLQRQLPHPERAQPELEEDDIDDKTIAMGLRAILKWCTATDLSLAQTKHIGSKVQVRENDRACKFLDENQCFCCSCEPSSLTNFFLHGLIPRPSLLIFCRSISRVC
jgi:hypothetical protein